MAEMKAVARSLLDLPVEAKKKNVVEGSGYLEPNEAYPLYESLGLRDMGSAQGVDVFCSQLNASPHQREIMKTYREAVHELAMDIADKLTRSMGLDSGQFEQDEQIQLHPRNCWFYWCTTTYAYGIPGHSSR
ncbi:hypothetical protein BT93_J1756 [Corymbia citriodora subsp. variegata]|nr:hypothetical protein BT93_J1756 [Corymbia citriodora subsp. variegata]